MIKLVIPMKRRPGIAIPEIREDEQKVVDMRFMRSYIVEPLKEAQDMAMLGGSYLPRFCWLKAPITLALLLVRALSGCRGRFHIPRQTAQRLRNSRTRKSQSKFHLHHACVGAISERPRITDSRH